MTNNTKIWLCGITQNSKSGIDDMTRDITGYIDGLIFVDHQSSDGTYESLESRKGDGEIISLPWMDNHSWSMNGFLNSKKLQPGDYFIVLDSSERLNIEFAKNLRSLVKEFEIRNINTVYHYSKLAIARYNSNMMFAASPHWGLHGVQNHAIRLEDTYPDPKTCIYSTRNDNRHADHFIKHFVKYYLYKSSNHLLLGRENNQQEYLSHEAIRNKFRLFCINELNIKELNTFSLLCYLKNNPLTYQLAYFINFEPILNDFYCYYVLGHSLEDVKKRRDNKEVFNISAK